MDLFGMRFHSTIMIKNIFIHIAGVSFLLTLLWGVSILFFAHTNQRQAVDFWGEWHSPNKEEGSVGITYSSWLLDLLIPEGGPLIATDLVSACHDEPIPLIPIRIDSEGVIEALCGMFGESRVVTVEFDEEFEGFRAILYDEAITHGVMSQSTRDRLLQ